MARFILEGPEDSVTTLLAGRVEGVGEAGTVVYRPPAHEARHRTWKSAGTAFEGLAAQGTGRLVLSLPPEP